MTAQCAALADEENTAWSFCPNLGAAIFFSVIFGLTTVTHVAQAISYRKGYSWVIITSALLQTATYAIRAASIQKPTEDILYTAWFILILISPLLTNAYVYMVMGRMVYNFTSNSKLAGIKAWRFTLYFVLLDILAFLIQVGGASIASGENVSRERILLGIHIYMGGIGFQQLFIFVFLWMAIIFHRGLSPVNKSSKTRGVLSLLNVLYAVLFLITGRIIFRLVEYYNGLDSTIPNQEAYQYCLDSLPMFIALVLLNICHPGRIMPGKESDFPSRKVRKAMGKIKSGNSISPASDGVVRLDNFPNSVGNGDLEETMKPTIERHHRVSDI